MTSQEAIGRSSAFQAEREVLAGLVERVTFHNLDNGFCVLRVQARDQRDLVTVVGHGAAITADEFIRVSCCIVPGSRSGGRPWLAAAATVNVQRTCPKLRNLVIA